jgi:hypothetical protein
LIHHHLNSHKLIISIYVRNELIPPKLMEWTYDSSPISERSAHSGLEVKSATFIVLSL